MKQDGFNSTTGRFGVVPITLETPPKIYADAVEPFMTMEYS